MEDFFQHPDTALQLEHEREDLRVELQTFVGDHQVHWPVHLSPVHTDIQFLAK